MQQETYIGNNKEKASRYVQSLSQRGVELRVIDSGYDNLVIIAGDLLYRFPRTGEVWEQGIVERTILERLTAHPDLPVPRLREIHEHPAYAVLESLPGDNLTLERLRHLPEDIQVKIGSAIGEFAFHFHSLFTPDEVTQFLSDKDPQASYVAYLKQVLLDSGRTDPDYGEIAAWVYDEWPKHMHGDRLVIHDDLHIHNLLFDENQRLSGVIDFGDITLGSPEQELRHLYWMSDPVLEGALRAYEQLSGLSLDRELVKLCAVSQEISGLYDPARSYMHDRARKNLAFRF